MKRSTGIWTASGRSWISHMNKDARWWRQLRCTSLGAASRSAEQDTKKLQKHRGQDEWTGAVYCRAQDVMGRRESPDCTEGRTGTAGTWCITKCCCLNNLYWIFKEPSKGGYYPILKMGKPSLNQRNPFLPGRPRRQSLGQRVKCSIFQGCSCREQRSRPRNQTRRKKSWLETAVWRQRLGVSTAECRRPSLGQSCKRLNNWTSEQPPAPTSWAEDHLTGS